MANGKGAGAARAASAGEDLRSVAASHIQRIVGPTILMGDGSYFDYENPEASTMTIEDFAYGLAYTCRFRGQTRSPLTGRRVFYSVAEHCVRMAAHVEEDGHDRVHVKAAMMHEAGEPVCGDMVGPLKQLFPEFRTLEKRCEAAALSRFGVSIPDPDLIKRYDLRMLATEKRDLMPASRDHEWSWVRGFEPFLEIIEPFDCPDTAAEAFLYLWRELAA
jgi:hypothetical protein